MNRVGDSWNAWMVLSTMFQSQVTPKGTEYTKTNLVETNQGVRKVEETHYTVYNVKGQKEQYYHPGSIVDIEA